MTGSAVAAVAALAALIVLTAAIVVGERARRAGRARAASQIRPILFRALDGGDVDPRVIDALKPAQQRALEAQARSLLPKLKGEDKESLARLLDRRGAIDSARGQIHSRRATTRANAGKFLGEAGSPVTVHDMLELLELLADPNPQVRCSAARSLGQLGNPGALSPLLASLEGARPVPVDVVADAIFQIRDCPVSTLRQALKSQSEPTRAVAVELLGRFQSLAAVGNVIDVLHHDHSVEVQARAARCLGRMGTPRAVDPLLSCLADGPVAIRAQAIWALGEIGAPRAIAALQTIVLTSSPQMGDLAARALRAMGPQGIRTLTQIAEGGGHTASVAAGALASDGDLETSSSR